MRFSSSTINSLTPELVIDLVKYTASHEVSFVFDNKDVLVINMNAGEFFELGRVEYVQVVYGEAMSVTIQGERSYKGCGQQFFAVQHLDKAVTAFLDRLKSNQPSSPYSTNVVSFSLDEIKLIPTILSHTVH